MQKYRRFTDEATGINPFIKAKSPAKLTTIITSALIAVIKINILAILMLPIMLSLLLQNSIARTNPVSYIVGLPVRILGFLVGLWGVDDFNFRNGVGKNGSKGKLILSNSVCILDPIYYMSILSPVKFIVSHPEEDKFYAIGGIGAFFTILGDKQPFFNQKIQNGENFKSLLSRQLNNGVNCVVFYEGIRTNGLGTIKISKKLSQHLFDLQKDYIVSHLKYTSCPQGLFSMVSNPLVLFCTALGTCSISLRVRSLQINIKDEHSGIDVQKDIDNFLLANGTKLLETEPASYYQFIDFYGKSQKSGYTQIGQQNKDN